VFRTSGGVLALMFIYVILGGIPLATLTIGARRAAWKGVVRLGLFLRPHWPEVTP
jgi:hypothetical protein